MWHCLCRPLRVSGGNTHVNWLCVSSTAVANAVVSDSSCCCGLGGLTMPWWGPVVGQVMSEMGGGHTKSLGVYRAGDKIGAHVSLVSLPVFGHGCGCAPLFVWAITGLLVWQFGVNTRCRTVHRSLCIRHTAVVAQRLLASAEKCRVAYEAL